MKKISVTISLLLFTTLLMTTANALAVDGVTDDTIQPRYTGVSRLDASLTIDASGYASASGHVYVLPGYTADVSVSLCRDSGANVATWYDSGSGKIDIEKSRYVTANHDYYVVVSVDVYDSNGRLADSIEKESVVVSC